MREKILLLLCSFLLFACKKDLAPMSGCTENTAVNYNANAIIDDGSCNFFSTIPFIIETPSGFPEMNIPSNNPMTVQGVSLGKKLFHDNILSGNGMQACASCHLQSAAFSDPNQFSTGIDGFFW
jgi:cytochrome c peroxidase